jgi:hypothetical protein
MEEQLHKLLKSDLELALGAKRFQHNNSRTFLGDYVASTAVNVHSA